MTITIQLPPDLEQAVRSRAAKKGVTVETLVLSALRQDFIPSAGNSSIQQEPTANGSSAEASEALSPDTDRAHTVVELAQAWLKITRPIAHDDSTLSVDPDDYPLF